MRLRVGYEMSFAFPQPTPALLMLHIHHSRAADIIIPDRIRTFPEVDVAAYYDSFGNWCSRITAPAGTMRIIAGAELHDSGLPDPVHPLAWQHDVQDLPAETLVFLLGSRYCETDRLTDIAWTLFERAPMGWGRVQAICDFVHHHIAFNYMDARSTRSAYEAYVEGKGVCRDYAHLAIAFCRCMNIPARYCTGYLPDIAVATPHIPMDFAGWFEAYLNGAWHTFDARNNTPRIGRVLMARGRDATDVALSTTFGPNVLTSFRVEACEIAP